MQSACPTRYCVHVAKITNLINAAKLKPGEIKPLVFQLYFVKRLASAFVNTLCKSFGNINMSMAYRFLS